MNQPTDSQRAAEYERRPIDDETVVIKPGMSIGQVMRDVTQRAGDPLFSPRSRLRKNFVTSW